MAEHAQLQRETQLVAGAPLAPMFCRPSLDLQRDTLRTAGVHAVNVCHDLASGVRADPAGEFERELIRERTGGRA